MNNKKKVDMKKNIIIRKTREPSPTNEEVNLLFNLLPDGDALKISFGLILIGLRPIEVCNLKWNCFELKDDKLISITHLMYKPTSRITKSNINLYYKEVRKEWLSDWLEKQIKQYSKTAPVYERGKMFGFSTPDSFNKWFSKVRKLYRSKKKFMKKYSFVNYEDYKFLLDKNFYSLNKDICNKTRYRISPYSLRRFGLTFLYYTKFKSDIISTAKYSGHSHPKTLLDHYIMTKEGIGLKEHQTDLTLDHFIGLRDQFQTTITDYFTKKTNRFVQTNKFKDPRQSQINAFVKEKSVNIEKVEVLKNMEGNKMIKMEVEFSDEFFNENLKGKKEVPLFVNNDIYYAEIEEVSLNN